MKNQISLCYHPTKTVLIDDNQDFLKAIKLELERDLHCSSFVSPVQALTFFKQDHKPKPFTERCFIEPVDERADHLFFNVDLRQIHQEVYLGDRFNDIAVIVVDYTMPRMDGLTLSRHIKDLYPHIRIILLTGEADNDLAVQAFNEGIIDKFIKKGTPELSKLLIETIKILERKYFQLLSQSIIDKLNGVAHKLNRLSDPNLISFFNQICREKAIVEYYLIDGNGSFLLIDNKGTPAWFVLLNGQDIQEFYSYALLEKAPMAVIEALKTQQKLPFFYTEDDLQTPPADWENYLHPAKPVPQAADYYYALIEDASAYHWETAEIISYKTYLDQLA